jgi:hypothetical protein
MHYWMGSKGNSVSARSTYLDQTPERRFRLGSGGKDELNLWDPSGKKINPTALR